MPGQPRPPDIDDEDESSRFLVRLYQRILFHLDDIFQFTLVLVGFVCMGAACGFERSLLPRMARETFRQTKSSTRLNFVATFGLSKAIANAISGPLSDKWGRKIVLVLGCIIAVPVMPFIIYAPSWNSITLMNGAFGLSQGLIGSSLFFLLIDIMGPTRRGVAVGLGESTIYISTAIVNILAGALAATYGFRPVPFYVATAFVVVGLLCTIPLKDTLDQVRAEQSASERETRKKYARMESTQPSVLDEEYALMSRQGSSLFSGYVSPWVGSLRDAGSVSGYVSPWVGSVRADAASVFSLNKIREEVTADDQSILSVPTESEVQWLLAIKQKYNYRTRERTEADDQKGSAVPSYGDAPSVQVQEGPLETLLTLVRTNPSYVSLCVTGMVLNFKDGFAWGSFPVYFRREHNLNEEDTALLIALYPLCWGFGQAFTGALSDRFGRKLFLLEGTFACAVAMALYTLPSHFQNAYNPLDVFILADCILGFGTAAAYPALQAGAADEVDPINRGLALGFYRFVRDMGYVVGALVCGQLTDSIGYEATFQINAAILAGSFALLIANYHPKSEEESAVAVLLANEVKAVGGDGDNNDDDSDRTPPIPRKVKILANQCSDSW